MQVGQEQHPDDDEARKAQERERVAVQATALSADKLEEIAQSLDHIKDVSERVESRSMRKYVLERLQFPGERAVQDGESIGIGRGCVERLVRKECPLGFTGGAQFIDFCCELRGKVEQGLGCSPIQGNLAQHVTGFWIAIVGTSVSLYSENPRKGGRLYDAGGHGTSDLDVLVVFAPKTTFWRGGARHWKGRST